MAEQTEQTLKCAVLVGMREDGSVFVETYGTEQNLVIIDGLLDYGKDYVDDQWALRKAQAAAQAVAPVQEPAEEVETELITPAKPKRKPAAKKKKQQEVIEDVEV